MATLTSLRRRIFRTNDSGSELLELAFALPLLLLVIAGIMDFGFLFQRYEVVTNAAREGARMAVLSGYSCDNTTTSDVYSRVQNYLTSSGLTGSFTVQCNNTQTETLTPSNLTVTVATVTVTYPTSFLVLGPIIGLVGGSSPSNINLTASSTMRVEQGGS